MKIRLSIAAGAEVPIPFEHAGPAIRIGRDPDCELSLQGKAADNVSRQHARIELTAGGAALTDVGSRNGTLLNDELVKGAAPLRIGDRIQMGYTGATLTVLELDLDARPNDEAPPVRPALVIGARPSTVTAPPPAAPAPEPLEVVTQPVARAGGGMSRRAWLLLAGGLAIPALAGAGILVAKSFRGKEQDKPEGDEPRRKDLNERRRDEDQ